MLVPVTLILGDKFGLNVVQRLNLFLKRIILFLHALQLCIGLIGWLFEDCTPYTSNSSQGKLALQTGSLFVRKQVLSLQFVQLLVALKEQFVLLLDLGNVVGDNAVMAVTIVNEFVKLVDFVLELVAAQLVVVHRLL